MLIPHLIILFITFTLLYFSTILPPFLLSVWYLCIIFIYFGFFAYIWGLWNPFLSTPYIIMNCLIFYLFIFFCFITIIYSTIGGIGGFSLINMIIVALIFWTVIYLGNMIIPLPLPVEGISQLLWPFIFCVVIIMIFLSY